MSDPIKPGLENLSKHGKVIIGSGLTGLLTAMHNPDFVIVGLDGGMAHISGELKLYLPMYLWQGPNTAKMLYELGIPFKSTSLKVGYLTKRGLDSNYDVEDRLEYSQKSRVFHDQNQTYSMSEGKTQVFIYDVDYIKLLDRLSELMVPGRIIPGRVELIDDDHIYIKVQDTVVQAPWKTILNTIPLCSLLKLLGGSTAELEGKSEYRWAPKSYQRVEVTRDPLLVRMGSSLREYAYIYVTDSQYPYTRITPDPKDPRYVTIEYVGSNGSGLNQPVGQILSGDPVEKIQMGVTGDQTIYNIGRYAEWRKGMKIEQTLGRIHDVRSEMGKE